MPALHNRERETPDQRRDYRDQRSDYQRSDDREISLGTGTILAIFFALALVCAVFFGLGYTMGRKSAQPSAIAASTATDTSLANSTYGGSKPAAGSPNSQISAAKREAVAAAKPPADPDGEIVTDATPSPEAPIADPRPRKESLSLANSVPQVVREAARSTPFSPQPPAMPAINPNGTSMVQVAAVSHQEDADVLISALKKRGYAVFIRQEPQDHLLHVQVGPFANKKDAEAMRQRLLSDGYNAIVK